MLAWAHTLRFFLEIQERVLIRNLEGMLNF